MLKQLRANTLQWTISNATLSALWAAGSYSDSYNSYDYGCDKELVSSTVEIAVVAPEGKPFAWLTKEYLNHDDDVIAYATCDEAVQHAATLAYKVGAHSLANALRGQGRVHSTAELLKLFTQLDKEYLSD